MLGGVTVDEAILRAYPNADVAVIVVWINMMEGDNPQTASHASAMFGDSRVKQFYDEKQLSAASFGSGLLGGATAWDVYMYFPAGISWTDDAPTPSRWAHQLAGLHFGKDHFRAGESLASFLHEILAESYEAALPAPDRATLIRSQQAALKRIRTARSAEKAAPPANQRCQRCQDSGVVGECQLAEWRYVRAARTQAGGLAWEMSGSATTPEDSALHGKNPSCLLFNVDKLQCASCTSNLALQVLVVPGVESVEISIDSGQLAVHPSRSSSENLASIVISTIRTAGYSAETAATGASLVSESEMLDNLAHRACGSEGCLKNRSIECDRSNYRN